MSLPVIGNWGSCRGDAKTCGVIVNLPLVGAVPFPPLGRLTLTYHADTGLADWRTAEGDLPDLGGLGGFDLGESWYWNLGAWTDHGDVRTPARALHMKITVSTTVPMTGDGNPSEWPEQEITGVGEGSYQGQGQRTWEWEFFWASGGTAETPLYDVRVQSVSGKLNGVQFYSKVLQADGTYQENAWAWLATWIAAHPEVPISDYMGSVNIAVAPGWYADGGSTQTIDANGATTEFHGSVTSPVDGAVYTTQITIVKDQLWGYWDVQPGALIAEADSILRNYNLDDLSRTYPFWDEDDGTGNSVAKTVQFKEHHFYYIYPFPKQVSGSRWKEIVWGCQEPRWEDALDVGGNKASPNPNGVSFLGLGEGWCVGGMSVEEGWASGYDWTKFSLNYGPLNNRDLPRFSCLRRSRLGGGIFGSMNPGSCSAFYDPYNNLSPFLTTRNMYFGGVFGAGEALLSTTLATWDDYLEVSKCSCAAGAEEAVCLVQYQQDIGRERSGWLSNDGHSPAMPFDLAADPPVCEAVDPSNFRLSRSNLKPNTTYPSDCTMAFGAVLRSGQRQYAGSNVSQLTADGQSIEVLYWTDLLDHWPADCEVGI